MRGARGEPNRETTGATGSRAVDSVSRHDPPAAVQLTLLELQATVPPNTHASTLRRIRLSCAHARARARCCTTGVLDGRWPRAPTGEEPSTDRSIPTACTKCTNDALMHLLHSALIGLVRSSQFNSPRRPAPGGGPQRDARGQISSGRDSTS